MLNTKILVIYPEVTKTKMAVYQNGEVNFLKTIRHKPEVLDGFNDINDQLLFRVDAVMNEKGALVWNQTHSAPTQHGNLLAVHPPGHIKCHNPLQTPHHPFNSAKKRR